MNDLIYYSAKADKDTIYFHQSMHQNYKAELVK